MEIDLQLLFNEIETRNFTVSRFSRDLGIKATKVYSWKAGRGHPKGEDYVKIKEWLKNKNESVQPLEDNYLLTVLIDRVAQLLAKHSGNSVIVESKQIEKDAELLREMKTKG
jgi:hypothetical protein